MKRLTRTQADALRQIRAVGVWHAYNGVSRTTVAVLEREDLVRVEWTVTTRTNRRSGRSHSQLDWVARPVLIAEEQYGGGRFL